MTTKAKKQIVRNETQQTLSDIFANIKIITDDYVKYIETDLTKPALKTQPK